MLFLVVVIVVATFIVTVGFKTLQVHGVGLLLNKCKKRIIQQTFTLNSHQAEIYLLLPNVEEASTLTRPAVLHVCVSGFRQPLYFSVGIRRRDSLDILNATCFRELSLNLCLALPQSGRAGFGFDPETERVVRLDEISSADGQSVPTPQQPQSASLLSRPPSFGAHFQSGRAGSDIPVHEQHQFQSLVTW